MNGELSRKLAKFLLNKLPKDRSVLVKTGEFLGFVHNLYRRERLLRDFMLNPQVANEKKVEYLTSLSQKFSLPSEIKDFISYLVELNAVPMLGEVKRLYDYEVEKFLRLSKAFILTARKLDDQTLESIKSKVKEILNRELEFEVKEDPSLIGGFVVKTTGFVLDASVRRALEKLT